MVSCFVKTSLSEEYLRVKVSLHCYIMAASAPAVGLCSEGDLHLIAVGRVFVKNVLAECLDVIPLGKFLGVKVLCRGFMMQVVEISISFWCEIDARVTLHIS